MKKFKRLNVPERVNFNETPKNRQSIRCKDLTEAKDCHIQVDCAYCIFYVHNLQDFIAWEKEKVIGP